MFFSWKKSAYLLYRKMKALVTCFVYQMCRVFPLKKNRICVCTFEGKGGFGCNPKYIVKELHKRNPSYEFVWLVNDTKKFFPAYIKKIKNTLWNRAYWLSTSKVWIDNYRKPYGTCKCKKQYYLNTNHFTLAMKSTGLWRGKAFSEMAYLVSKNDSDMIDDIVIDSKWCEDSFGKAMVYAGNYLKIGMPRCDVLYGDRSVYHRKFCMKHVLPPDAKILMFAPTFRECAKNGKRNVFSAQWTIDFKRLMTNLEKRFGGAWYLCIRVHPQLAPFFREYKDEKIQERLIDESQADDMYEILAGMDAYITDYSSAMFDAGFAGIPVFIYADDIESYANDRGSLMWNMTSDSLDHVTNNKIMTPDIDVVLPFLIARNNDELEENIMKYDKTIYEKKMKQLKEKTMLIFDGEASKRAADKIETFLQ